MTPAIQQATSKLITLSNGQIIGHPLTRREYKRQLRQRKRERRAAYRAAQRGGYSYESAGKLVRAAVKVAQRTKDGEQ